MPQTLHITSVPKSATMKVNAGWQLVDLVSVQTKANSDLHLGRI